MYQILDLNVYLFALKFEIIDYIPDTNDFFK